MNYLINFALFINAIIIPLFLVEMFSFERISDPKKKGDLATFIILIFLFYLISFFIIFSLGFVAKNLYYMLALVFVVIPFILGKFVDYSKLKLYVLLHIVAYVVSLAYLLKIH